MSDAIRKKTETVFSLIGPTPKNLYRIRIVTEVSGVRIESTVNELFTEDQAKAKLYQIEKGGK